MFFLPILYYCLFQTVASVDVSYFSDWTMMGGRPVQPTCVDIPRNMTLCHNIGYTKMRLPNLLDHDTMAEVSQQAGSWVPLLNINCHPDTQLFLCSLFSPVCLDRPIYPCRSLCDQVQIGCEGRMQNYGYPWPDFLRCEKFPLDNDMCITAQSGTSTAHEKDIDCQVCNQVETYENILDHFCRSEFAIKTKVRKVKKTRISCKKSKVLKTWSMDKAELRTIRRPTFVLDNVKECCSQYFGPDAKDNYLVMGVRRGSDLVPTFIMPWNTHLKPFRSATRMFKRLDCSDPKMVSESMIGENIQTNNKSVRRAPSSKSNRQQRKRTNQKKAGKRAKSTTEKSVTAISSGKGETNS